MKMIIVATLTILTLALAGLFAQTAQAAYDPFAQACINSNGQSSVCEDRNKNQDAGTNNSIYGKDGILSKAITILDIVIGVAAVIMIIIGGFKFVLSGGDSNAVTTARNTVLYAVVGIIIAVSGQLIVKFVLNRL